MLIEVRLTKESLSQSSWKLDSFVIFRITLTERKYWLILTDCWLWADLDAFKKIDFINMIYHVKNKKMIFIRLDVQFILFLSRTLNSAERNYWSTKLKVADLVWVIRKIRHMMKSTLKSLTIIYINHAVAVTIAKQTSLITANTDKLNLRLI